MSIFRKRDWRAGIRRIGRETVDSIADAIIDRRLVRALKQFRASAAYTNVPAARVLVVGVQSPKRGHSLAGIFRRMTSDKHRIEHASCGVGTRSKPENTNALLSDFTLSDFDFIITTDDDITLPAHFIDDVLAIMEVARLDIAGPAHRRKSYHNLDITRRGAEALVRITDFVEVGPLVVFRRSTFPNVIPFPVTRFGWGVDLLWSKIADEKGWRLGIVDATPIRHLSPAGSNYNWAAAHAEMERFRVDNGIALSVDHLSVRGHDLRLDQLIGKNR